MKNKILKKVILVVVCVTVVVSAFVLPSFAYSVYEPSTDNTGFSENGFIPKITMPDVFMKVDLYTNDVKKSSANFPLFSNVNYSYENRLFVQVPDAGDYGQLVGYSDTVETDIYETENEHLALLRQSMYNYFSPNYSASNVDFDYYITSIVCDSLYYNNGMPYGMNYSTFIYLDDTYDIGDTFSYTNYITYNNSSGASLGSLDRGTATVTYGENNQKGVYIYFYNSSILDPDWLVERSEIKFTTPIKIDNYSYEGESGFIHTTSRFLCSNGYWLYISEYLRNSDLDDYQIGYSDGFSAGETSGYEDGYSEGTSVGYNNGYNTGYSEGYDVGYEEGGSGVSTNPFDFILSSVSSFLSWEFIPGISFSIIASVFVGAVLMIILLKKLAGG